MKNNVVKKQVLKAISIGLAAVMATTPITAFAAEGEGTGDEPQPEPTTEGEETQKNTAFEAANTAEQEAKTSVEKAESSAGVIKNEVINGNENMDKVNPGEAGVDASEKDLAQAVIDAANDVEDSSATEGASLDDAQKSLDVVETQLVTAATNDTLADTEMKKAENQTEAAESAAKDMQDIADQANTTITNKTDEIKNATSSDAARTAYTEAETALANATTEYNEKLQAYNEANTAYTTAINELATYEENYKNALVSAGTNAAQAKTELVNAQKKAGALCTAVEIAKKAVDDSAMSALAKADDAAKTQGSWKALDALFISIMQDYYLPSKGINGAVVTRVQGDDNDSQNYFTAVYTDSDGVKHTDYYNYKNAMNASKKDMQNMVIFEKRQEEVNWKEAMKSNPDQYAYTENDKKQIVSKEELSEGLTSGSYVGITTGEGDAAEASYFVKNDVTDTTSLSESDTTEGNVRTVVTISDDKKETYKLDEEGKLVKEVTADVTTTTYTGYSLSAKADEHYDDADAAKAAGKEALRAELREKGLSDAQIEEVVNSATIDSTSKSKTVTEDVYTYTASATFVPVFQKKINVDDDERGESFSDPKGDAINDQYEDEIDDFEADNKILSDSGTTYLKATKKSGLLNVNNYHVEGYIDVIYEEKTTGTLDFSNWDTLDASWKALLQFENPIAAAAKSKQARKEAIKEAIEASGGIIDIDDIEIGNGNWETAKITYIAAKTVTATGASAKEAKDNIANAIADKGSTLANYLRADNIKVSDTVVSMKTGTVDKQIATFGYVITYQLVDSDKENMLIQTDTYGNANKMTGEIIQNKNLKDGNILFSTKDNEAYKKDVADAKELQAKYEQLQKDADQAARDVEDANAKVDALQDEIEKLEANKHTNRNQDAIDALKTRLEQAKTDKEKAEEKLGEAEDNLKNAEDELEKKIRELSPEPETTPSPRTTPAPTADDDTIIIADAPIALAAVAAQADDTLLTEQAVLGATRAETTRTVATEVNEATESEELSADEEQEDLVALVETTEKEDKQEVVNIEEEGVALADGITKKGFNWWWLLLLLVGAGATEEGIRRNRKKKAKESSNENE